MSLKTYIDTVPTYAAGIGIIGISVVILTIILTRNVGIRVAGLLSLSQIIGVWIVFLLAGSVAKEKRHIQIGYFTDKIPEPFDRWHEIGVLVLNIIASLIFLYSAFLATLSGLNSTVSGLGVPTAVYFSAPLIGFGLLTIVYLLQFGELFDAEEKWRSVTSND